MCWRIRFVAIVHLQKALVTAMNPIRNLPLIGENNIGESGGGGVTGGRNPSFKFEK